MKKLWVLLAAPVAAMVIACGAGGADDKGEAVSGAAAGADAKAGDSDDAGKPDDGVYKFGQTVKFKDGSTLTVAKPVKFKKDRYAIGGEGKKVFLKFKATFTNNTDEVFDPALTSASASGDGTEADSVFQNGMDAPDNKLLPGKSVTWWMGYGFDSAKTYQLEVNVGFLDYGSVIFTP